jgi:hypothetical protein
MTHRNAKASFAVWHPHCHISEHKAMFLVLWVGLCSSPPLCFLENSSLAPGLPPCAEEQPVEVALGRHNAVGLM